MWNPTPQQVLEELQSNSPQTKAQLGRSFRCSPYTIQGRVNTLKEDGEVIWHDVSGYHWVNPTKPLNAETGLLGVQNKNWIMGTVRQVIILMGKPMLGVAPLIDQAIINRLTAEERKYLQGELLRIAGLITYLENSAHWYRPQQRKLIT